jgi:carboxyl-terminal processing protease
MNVIKSIYKKSIVGFVIILGLFGISTELNDFEIAKNLEIFSNIYRELNTFYVDEVDPEYLMETGANAMLNSLDPYTTYIPANEVAQFRSTITGKYGGVGASIMQGKEHVIISLPYSGGPAQVAGLQVGDEMIEIDGENVEGNNVRQISDKMRGVPNSDVNIKIKRYGFDKPLAFTLTRKEIKVNNTPYHGMIQNDIAYIVLSSFSENAGKNVADALSELKENNTVKGVVLDLRGNTGGLLTEAVNVANVFLDKGSMVVQIKGRDKERHQVFRALNQPVDNIIPLCVLIDKNSASASEIVAGAVQDLDRGVILGQRSFGKGLVQNTRDLSFGAKVKLTTARYYIPSGRCIQALKYKNGKPSQIADSLHSPFQTIGGRAVYDGGGIKPDVSVDNLIFLNIIKELNKEMFLFEFASSYKFKHNTIAAASDFELSDKDFDDFLKFLDDKGYAYKTQTEVLLDVLEEMADKESYIDEVSDELKEIKTVLAKSRTGELKKHKDRFLFVLQRYIVSHYYYRKGSIQAGIHFDTELKGASGILSDNEAYSKILKPVKQN